MAGDRIGGFIMKHSVEKLEGGMVKLSFEIEQDKFNAAIKAVFEKQKKNISIPGFRKGKVPFAMVCQYYGKAMFYDDALNECLPDAYKQAVEEEGLTVMSRPEIDLEVFTPDTEIMMTAIVAVKPEVKLGEYKGLKKEMEDITVTDEDVEKEIETVLRRNARKVEITDRAAQMDDTCNIDYVGTVDGVAFEGGSAEGFDLKLGSNSFIPGYEEQIVGHNVGETFDVNVTFPEKYHAEDLAGKDAVFSVTLNKITVDELPLLDDELVKELSKFDTVAEYREDTKKTLTERKERAAKDEMKNKLIEAVTAAAEVEIPAAAIVEKCDEQIQQFAQQLSYQGMDINQYMKMSGTTIDQLRDEIKPSAEKNLKEALVMEAVAKAEGLEVSDEDVDKEMEDMAKMYGMDIETIKGYMAGNELENMKAEMLVRKAVDFVVENAID